VTCSRAQINYMGCTYFRITIKSDTVSTVYMVRSDKVSEFFNNKIDYLSGDCSITVKGRFPTHKDTRKWFVVSPNNK
jgi:hypothetical protein